MRIYRPVNDIYTCTNDTGNEQKYVMKEVKGCYPMLVPLEDAFKRKKLRQMAEHCRIPVWKPEQKK